MQFIESFKEDDRVIGHYFCKEKRYCKTKAGKDYISLKLQDKTGIVSGKIWDISSDISEFSENDFIKIDGAVLLYQNDLQIKISRVRKSEASEYVKSDYIPSTDKDVAVMQSEITRLCKSVKNPYLNNLLNKIFQEPEIADRFATHSAAKSMHHSFSGGLLEHTLSVVNICAYLCGQYKYVNRDLTITAALLHDVGKIYELSPFPENDYTDDGQLLGHSYIALEIIDQNAKKVENFPPKLLNLLKHCIISHHGEYVYGAARLPSIIEALILHFADEADAKIKAFETAVGENRTSGAWIGFDKCLDRKLRKSDFD